MQTNAVDGFQDRRHVLNMRFLTESRIEKIWRRMNTSKRANVIDLIEVVGLERCRHCIRFIKECFTGKSPTLTLPHLTECMPRIYVRDCTSANYRRKCRLSEAKATHPSRSTAAVTQRVRKCRVPVGQYHNFE